MNLSNEIDHESDLVSNYSSLYMSEELSDIKLIVWIGNQQCEIVEGETVMKDVELERTEINVHKLVLAANNNYFRSLLYIDMKESTEKKIKILVSNIRGFELLLKYVYTGKFRLDNLNEEIIVHVLKMSNQFLFNKLEYEIFNHLKTTINIKNVCMIHDLATLYHLDDLAEICCSFTDQHALEVIRHESFYCLSQATLKQMIKRDSFCAQEIDIFKAVKEWSARNPNEEG